jgi:type IV conjugative transfer system protein TraL
MDERYLIPRTLDDPPLFFMWSFDEAALVLIWALLGALLGLLLPALVLGVICARLFNRMKAEGGRGLLVRILYWYTPSSWWFPSIAPSCVREYVGG